MMLILSVAKVLIHDKLNITSIDASELSEHLSLNTYDYIIINGGDGTIRRVVKQLYTLDTLPKIILNPTGSFNVIAKRHCVPKVKVILEKLVQNEVVNTQIQQIYTLNKEVFLFSAGNMGDLQHIFLSESLRFGILKKGMSKYLLAAIFLLPVHLIITPFMLLSSNRFFIFTPASFIKKFGSFYGEVKEMTIELEDSYNHMELDGDIVTIEEQVLKIQNAGSIEIVTR